MHRRRAGLSFTSLFVCQIVASATVIGAQRASVGDENILISISQWPHLDLSLSDASPSRGRR